MSNGRTSAVCVVVFALKKLMTGGWDEGVQDPCQSSVPRIVGL